MNDSHPDPTSPFQDSPPFADADEALGRRFLAWLRAARDEAAQVEADAQRDASTTEGGDRRLEHDHFGHDHAAGEATCEHEAVGLYRLVEEFTALRQEIKLQAKGARGLEDQVGGLLPRLDRQVESYDELQRRVAGTLDAATRAISQAAQAGAAAGVGSAQLQALALAVADLDDALDRGRRQMTRAADELLGDPLPGVAAAIDEAYARQSAFARWAGRKFFAQVKEALSGEHAARRRQLVDALLDGYTLIQQRLARLMAKEEIVRIVVLGQPVDPEQMVVVEAVAADGAARPGEVVEEVRRGYLWRGKLLRYAEVKAARIG